VEGEKSVLQAWSMGIKNVVAVCGLTVSPIQVEILKRKGVEKVILGFDNDVRWDDTENRYAHIKKWARAVFRMEKMGLDTHVLIDKAGVLGLKDSPFDRGKEAFDQLTRLGADWVREEVEKNEGW
jgi:basic membrane lipoprotein Med (substrate-binding protein (PBP1-ABC) superfamily)